MKKHLGEMLFLRALYKKNEVLLSLHYGTLKLLMYSALEKGKAELQQQKQDCFLIYLLNFRSTWMKARKILGLSSFFRELMGLVLMMQLIYLSLYRNKPPSLP